MILRRSGLGLQMGKFRQCLELLVRDTIMNGYYSLNLYCSHDVYNIYVSLFSSQITEFIDKTT